MYFKKERPSQDPFLNFGKKRSIYRYFFLKGTSLNFDMYLASGPNSYLGGLKFKNPAFFNGEIFSAYNGIIEANAVYDRSGGVAFPPPKMDSKVLNCSAFKILCNDKNLMYQYFGKFMPKSFEIKTATDLKVFLKKFSPASLAVLKPANGLGGKNILIDKASNLASAVLEKGMRYTLQEFIDTSRGITGLTTQTHDLRVVIVNGKIILSHLRTPKQGSLLANAAQGGTLQEVPLEKIPANVLSIVSEMQKIIDKKFNFPIYSIDFGVTENGPLVFELNDQIGFPSEDMLNAKPFINALFESLVTLANVNC